jgi:hypothetical protein
MLISSFSFKGNKDKELFELKGKLFELMCQGSCFSTPLSGLFQEDEA